MTQREFEWIEKALRSSLRAGAPGLSEVMQNAVVVSVVRKILPMVEKAGINVMDEKMAGINTMDEEK